MNEPVRWDGMRASDADRELVIGRLREAHNEGRLDLAEFDERVRQAWAARTYGELDTVTTDLPQSPELSRRPNERAPQSPQSSQPAPASRSGKGFRAAVAVWAAVTGVNFVIWVLVSATTFEFIYPWWIWVGGPWGAVLLVTYIASRFDRPT